MIFTTFTLLEIAKGHSMYFAPKNIESILQFIKYEQIYSQYSSIYNKRAFQGFQENLFLYFSRFFKVFLESYLFSRFSRSLFRIQGFSRFLQVFQGSGHPELIFEGRLHKYPLFSIFEYSLFPSFIHNLTNLEKI